MRFWILAAAAGVIFWRVVAYWSPSPFIATPDSLRLPFALLGLLFLACGVWTWLLQPDRFSHVFLVYSMGTAVHWGGAIGTSHRGPDLTLFFLYLGLSAVGSAALLHLACIYPRSGSLARGWLAAFYAPAAAALMLAGPAGRAPEAVIGAAVGGVLIATEVLAIGAGVIFLWRLLTSDALTRRSARLTLIFLGLAAPFLVTLMAAGGFLPGEPEAWNLVLGVIPICLALALTAARPGLTAGRA